jgi:CUB/sushi domain-containing protein
MHECAVIKDCGHPGNITNGDVDVSDGTKGGAFARYTCDSGYKLSGRNYRVCQNDHGLWSGTEPKCQVPVTCPELNDTIEHGYIRITQTSTDYYARYYCNRFYVRKGVANRDCNVFTGEWEGTEPTCQKGFVECDYPQNITNGTVSVSDEILPGAYARYSCNYRFVLNGTSTRRCRYDGTWTETEPTCIERKECHHPGDIDGGSVTVYGDFVEYTCDIGYEWHGRRIRYCNQLTGKWSGQPTTCKKSNIDCGHPGNFTNGVITLFEGTKLRATIKYTCNSIYKLNGPSHRTCGLNGEWTGVTPTCEARI